MCHIRTFFYDIVGNWELQRRVHPRTRVGGGAHEVGGAGVSMANGVLCNPNYRQF